MCKIPLINSFDLKSRTHEHGDILMLLIVEFSIKFPAIYVNIKKIYLKKIKDTLEKSSLKQHLIHKDEEAKLYM